MGFLSKLIGGGALQERAAVATAKAEMQARREAEKAAEAATRAEAYFMCAMGGDRENRSRDARRKAAIKLVLAGDTAKGREAWLAIARDYPGELHIALEQVGVCYHLERDYCAALENYQAAIRVGADAGHLHDNIAEARNGLAALG